MRKIKFKLSREEMKSLLLILELSCKSDYSGLQDLAAKELLLKLFLKLFSRVPSMKIKDNPLSVTLPELWAFITLTNKLVYCLGPYEMVLIGRISGETNRLTS